MIANRWIATNWGQRLSLNGFVTLGNSQGVTIRDCNYSQQCYQGDNEDMYRLKEEGKVYSIQDVILQCVRRRMKNRLESGTLLELKKDVLLCAFLC